MSSRKRSRPIGENSAVRSFGIAYVNGPTHADQERQQPKKRKNEGQDAGKKVQIQIFPFSHAGEFKTNDAMDLHYTVTPPLPWLRMTRYNSFVLNGTKYYSEGFVLVANESTIERHEAAPSVGNAGPSKKNEDNWVARILEIRAADEHHVYARIYWMYWPDELPPGTVDGKKIVQGRQPYHGENELIASNHMDIINVLSVIMPATVHQWIESDDEEIQEALYWRQAYDLRNGQLSSVDLICKCETPANPDKMLIGCTNPDCGKWMHHECLNHDVLLRVYDELGTDKPHIKDQQAVKEKSGECTARPLSPTDTGEKETQPTIDVRSDGFQGSGLVRGADGETPRLGVPKSSVTRKGRKKGMDHNPYEGLFQATLKMSDGPIVWEMEDLRENVCGGEKTWTEQAHCLLCCVTID